MKSVLNVEVSCFRSYAGTDPKPVNLLTCLTSDKYADQIRALRTLSSSPQALPSKSRELG